MNPWVSFLIGVVIGFAIAYLTGAEYKSRE